MPLGGTGAKYPGLKIAFGGRFSKGSLFHFIQRVKLRICTKFHGCIATGSRVMINAPWRDWGQVPRSKNSIWGADFQRGLFFILFSVSNYVSVPSFMVVSPLAVEL